MQSVKVFTLIALSVCISRIVTLGLGYLLVVLWALRCSMLVSSTLGPFVVVCVQCVLLVRLDHLLATLWHIVLRVELLDMANRISGSHEHVHFLWRLTLAASYLSLLLF